MDSISIQKLSLATHYLRMIPFGSDQTMSTGTGFLYEYDDEIFLITNGHNITRLNPENNLRITASAAFPVKIETKFKEVFNEDNTAILSDFFEIDLYEDDEYKVPTWFIHPKFGYSVDVVAIPLEKKENLPKNISLFPINKFDFETEFGLQISDDVFILGYPFDVTGTLELPVWKRGTIATEPTLDLNELPKMLIDTATRSGMSGSPVIMKRSGIHGAANKTITGYEKIGTIRNFVGVYSGRIGAEDEFKAQLGIVWKKEVIEEILKEKIKGTIDFQKI